MKRVYALTVVIALVVLALGSSASARNMKGRASFEVDAGYAGFTFEGIGEWYGAWAAELEAFGWTVQENRPPNRAIPYAVKFKYGLSPTFSVTASAGAFSSTGKFASSISWADFTIDTTVSAAFFGAGVQIVLLDPPDFNIFTELEAGYWTVTYDESIQDTGSPGVVNKREAGGSKIGGTIIIGGEYVLPQKNISLIGKVGYRIGKLEQIATRRDDLGNSAVGEPLQTVDPVTFDYKDMQIDLGGWGASFGLCFPILAKK